MRELPRCNVKPWTDDFCLGDPAKDSSLLLHYSGGRKITHNILMGCKYVNADNVLPLLHKGRKHINGLISSYAEFN